MLPEALDVQAKQAKVTVKRCGMDFYSICSINLVCSCNHALTVLVPQVASQERHRLEIAFSRLSYITLNTFRGAQQLVSNAVISLPCRSLSVSWTSSYLKFIVINNVTTFVTSDGKSKTQNCKNMTIKNGKVFPVCAMKTNGWSRCSAASNRGIR